MPKRGLYNKLHKHFDQICISGGTLSGFKKPYLTQGGVKEVFHFLSNSPQKNCIPYLLKRTSMLKREPPSN